MHRYHASFSAIASGRRRVESIMGNGRGTERRIREYFTVKVCGDKGSAREVAEYWLNRPVDGANECANMFIQANRKRKRRKKKIEAARDDGQTRERFLKIVTRKSRELPQKFSFH